MARIGRLPGSFAVLTIGLICLLPAARATDAKFTEATLEYHGRRLSPKQTLTPWRPSFRAGPHLLVLGEEKVTALDPVTQAVHWEANLPEKSCDWLGSEGRIAYFSPPKSQAEIATAVGLAKVFRLDLQEGKWLPALRIASAGQGEAVFGLAVNEGVVAAMSATFIKSTDWPNDPKMTAYRVTAFDPSTAAEKWSRTFVAEKESRGSGIYLLSARRPNEAVAQIRFISVMGDDFVVCAGSAQSLICLNGKTGASRWTVDRIWEFQRGFIGPSVWSHLISRFAELQLSLRRDATDSELRELFDQRWTCSVIGGPMIVSHVDGDHYRIFVAVARAAPTLWSSALSDCVIYELDEDGDIWGMTTLPRIVAGSQAQVGKGTVDWILQQNSAARMQVSLVPAGNTPGSPDLLTRVVWYREFDPDRREAWLAVDKPADPAAFAASRVYRVFAGGYVQAKGDTVFHLPIVSIDRASGAQEDLLLHLPLTGEVALPETNIRSSEDGAFHHTSGPYFLGITRLRVDDDQLGVTVASESAATELIFDLGEAR
jgi:hypothetical protein